MSHTLVTPCPATAPIDLLRVRWMDPSIGRFTSFDDYEPPLGSMQDMNKYVYVGGDPINKIDPTGNFEMGLTGTLGILGASASLYSMFLPRAGAGYRAAQSFQQNSGLQFGQPFVAMQTTAFGDGFIRHLENDKPGTWESLIPIWGSLRNAFYNFHQGNTGWGVFYSGLAIVDFGFVQSLAKSVVSLARGGAGFVTVAIRRAADGSIEHVGWETAGRWFHAVRNASGAPTILKEMATNDVFRWFGTEALEGAGHSKQLLRVPVASLEGAIPTVGNEAANCVVAALHATMSGNYWLPAWAAGEALLRGLSWTADN